MYQIMHIISISTYEIVIYSKCSKKLEISLIIKKFIYSVPSYCNRVVQMRSDVQYYSYYFVCQASSALSNQPATLTSRHSPLLTSRSCRFAAISHPLSSSSVALNRRESTINKSAFCHFHGGFFRDFFEKLFELFCTSYLRSDCSLFSPLLPDDQVCFLFAQETEINSVECYVFDMMQKKHRQQHLCHEVRTN